MRGAYSFIKEAYKVYAGYGMQGTIFSVALNAYTDFAKDVLNIIDGVYVKTADADRLFITVNANVRTPLIPANALVRFQLMEIIVRLGLKRYYESGIT